MGKVKLYVTRAGEKVTPEVAKILGIPEGVESKVNIVAFLIEGGVIRPEDLPEVEEETRHLNDTIDTSKPTIISGRGPHWLYAVLVHNLHFVRELATWEPRKKVGIIIEGPNVGKAVEINGNITDVELGGKGRALLTAKDVGEKTILHFEVVGDRFIEPRVMRELDYPEIPSEKPAIIEGLMPIWMGQRLVAEYVHKAPVLAMYDPRMKAGVVVATHTEKFRVGDLIEVKPEEIQEVAKTRNTIIIGILGDPNSGKSVFLHLLNDELRRRRVITLTQEADITAPTQHWSLYAQDVRRELKKHMKPEERLRWIIESLRNAKESRAVDIVLADVGGGRPDLGQRITRENLAILRYMDGVVIVSRNDQEQISAWINELKTYFPDLKIYGILESRLDGTPTAKNGIGIIVGLDREAYKNGQIPEGTKKVVAEIATRILTGKYYIPEKINTKGLQEILRKMREETEREPETVTA